MHSLNSCTPLEDPQFIFRPPQLVLNWRISKELKQKLMLQKNCTQNNKNSCQFFNFVFKPAWASSFKVRVLISVTDFRNFGGGNSSWPLFKVRPLINLSHWFITALVGEVFVWSLPKVRVLMNKSLIFNAFKNWFFLCEEVQQLNHPKWSSFLYNDFL